MSLLDEVAGEVIGTGRARQCGVAALLASLSRRDAADVREALVSAYPHVAVARALARRWPDTAPKIGTIMRHRKGECTCDH